jgi:hypothetical protein
MGFRIFRIVVRIVSPTGNVPTGGREGEVGVARAPQEPNSPTDNCGLVIADCGLGRSLIRTPQSALRNRKRPFPNLCRQKTAVNLPARRRVDQKKATLLRWPLAVSGNTQTIPKSAIGNPQSFVVLSTPALGLCLAGLGLDVRGVVIHSAHVAFRTIRLIAL